MGSTGGFHTARWFYGFENWEVITKDQKLSLMDKFLEERKGVLTKPILNVIHLVWCGDYVLGLL